MRILIDIGHPAHVHLFRCFAHEMQSKGHEVLFTCRDKEFERLLLEAEGFEYVSFGRKYKSTVGKLWGLLKFDFMEWRQCLRFHPDILLSHGSMYAAHASWLIRKPHISFEDTYNMEQIRLYEPFSTAVLTGDYPHPEISKREIRFPGYHELAYLHPSRFTPDPSVLDTLGVGRCSDGQDGPARPYVLLRFVSWQATHDKGHKGMSLENKVKAVSELGRYAQVFISSEKPLPQELEKYRLPTAPERVHHVIAYSSLVFGESATMVSEGVVLGVPGVYIDNVGRYYTSEQESRYGLCSCFTESEEDQARAIERGKEILVVGKDEFASSHHRLLEDKIDTTSFLIDIVERYAGYKG